MRKRLLSITFGFTGAAVMLLGSNAASAAPASAGFSSYTMQNVYTRQCLTADHDAGRGAPAVEQPCNPGNRNQVWNVDPTRPGVIVNDGSDLCLYIHGASNTNGSPAFLYDCGAGEAPDSSDQTTDRKIF